MEHRIEESIDLDVPVRTAYDQWTRFEEFPQFMSGVREVVQIDDTHVRWRVEIAGAERTWTAEIIEQIPDERIAWATTSGKYNAGVVRFTPLATTRSRLHLRILYDSDGIAERLAEALDLTAARVRRELEAFRRHVEMRASEAEGWRGSVHHRHVESPARREP
ncbi:MAG TPA: SRPBCC family protein [Gammaproteobacteria bacterium]|nr:SRPBCC family protein [Gammaproteobacteria bacterium]